MARKGNAALKGTEELQALLKQRTWDKEVLLWFGSERSLLEALGSTNYANLDLLDLFDPDSLPEDDEATRDALIVGLRQHLRAMPKGPQERTVLIVKSIGLLARYKTGLKEFYDWFVGSYTVVVLLLEGLPDTSKLPSEVRCDANRLFGYFSEPGMLKNIYTAKGDSHARTGANNHSKTGTRTDPVSRQHYPEGKGSSYGFGLPLYTSLAQSF
jgi:hypothetical protein